MINFTEYKKIYFTFSAILILAGIISLVFFGLRPGIDFTGGSILEVEYYGDRPSNSEIRGKLSGLEIGTIYIQPTGEKSVILRLKDIDEDTHQLVLKELGESENINLRIEGLEGADLGAFSLIKEIRFESVGSVIGKELKDKTKIVIFLSLLAMVVYIALAFRKIKRPLKSWQYGIASIIALFHDILIPLGVFSVLGKFYNVEVSIPVITALLAVLGYSINNTVVVFDRIRENLLTRGEAYEEIVNSSINQTVVRQINTSLTTLFVSFSIFIFGGVTLRYFSLALIIGIVAGTYSSIFLAGNMLILWYNFRQKKFTG